MREPQAVTVDVIPQSMLLDRLCGLVIRVPGCRKEMYIVFPVRYELNLYMLCRRK
jgi:hypothetical protein